MESLEARCLLTADLRISEFLASNGGSLTDAFGESSDWFEVYNAGPAEVNLDNYYATDDPADLTKWSFPNRVLPAGGYMLVFASDRNTVLPGGETHTNFRLSASGEYLGLVDTDGTTVLNEYAPAFPVQYEDVAYGLEMVTSGSPVTLVADASPARALVPNNGGLGTSWTTTSFNDAGWTISGPTGVGFENTPENFASLIRTPVPVGTRDVYIRVPFSGTAISSLGLLTLRMKYDDGFVAYINGVKVASANAPDSPAYNSFAEANHPDNLAVQYENFDVSSVIPWLQPGQNVLAIHGMNLSDSSTDLLFLPELIGTPKRLTVPERTGFLEPPTPGYGNTTTFLGFTDPPEISVPHGFYDQPQTVTLSTTTPGALVAYTLDGSQPTVDANLNITHGLVYVGPLSVNTTTILRAAAFAPTLRASRTQTASYLFVNDIIQQSPAGQVPPGFPANGTNGQEMDYGIDPNILSLYGSQAVKDSLRSLSTFVINTESANLFDPATGIYVNAQNGGRTWERESSIEYILPNGSPGFQLDAGLRIRGGYSRGGFNPKHAFRMYFRGEYGAGKLEYPLFGSEGVASFDVLDLRTEQNYSWSSEGNPENSFVREVFSRDVQRDLGDPYTRSRYHHLYLNGVYWGVYMSQERSQEDFGESYLGGNDTDYDVIKSGLRETGGPTEVAAGNDAAWQQLFTLAQNLANNPTTNANNYWTMQGLHSDGTRNPAIPVLVDMENLIDYMLTIFHTGNRDSGLSQFLGDNVANNWFGMRNRNNPHEGFVFFQHDAEHSLGVAGTIANDRTGPFNNGNQSNYAYFNPQYLHQDLMASPEYRVRFGDRVQKHFFNGGVLTQTANTARLMARANQVNPAIIAEAARWGDAQTEPARNKNDWQSTINFITASFFPVRNNTVLNQLRGDALYPNLAAPSFNQHGGSVLPAFQIMLSAPAGTIYYTLEGSDPRMIGGGVSPTARNYAAPGNSPIQINQDTVIRARVLSGSTWSALNEATFTIVAAPADITNLRVTELQYHPSPPTPVELAVLPTATANDFQYLELMNTAPYPIAMGNVRLTSGVDFTFPAMTLAAGERVVVVKNQSAFDLRYSGVSARIAGEFAAGSELSNSSETITVRSSVSATIQSFTYADNDNWPSLPDGRGPSLEVIQLGGNYSDPLNWLPSRLSQGSPGTNGLPGTSTSALRITELHYNPVGGSTVEFIEFQNAGLQAIDLAGIRILEGVEFDLAGGSLTQLAPGDRGLAVANLAAFQAIYGTGRPVIGTFLAGNLSNGGERLIVVDGSNDVIHDFVFDDAAPFPVSPDGGGPSLENIHVAGNYSDGNNWRPSLVAGGTPGLDPRTGDFNGNQQLDCSDLTLLSQAVLGASSASRYDVNLDGMVTAADVHHWIQVLAVTLPGDANLDHVVDGSDFGIWNSRKFTTGTDWCQGDFNTDGLTDGSDFGIWNANKFQSTLRGFPIPTARRDLPATYEPLGRRSSARLAETSSVGQPSVGVLPFVTGGMLRPTQSIDLGRKTQSRQAPPRAAAVDLLLSRELLQNPTDTVADGGFGPPRSAVLRVPRPTG